MATVVFDENSDMEETLLNAMEQEEDKVDVNTKDKKKQTKPCVPKKSIASKDGIKKNCNTRPPPRPHKKMCTLKLTMTIQQLQNKREEIETQLKVNGVRLRKLLA
jgi:hypothetical protein